MMGRFELWDILSCGHLVMGRLDVGNFEKATFQEQDICMCTR
jgi:hypothetical protein